MEPLRDSEGRWCDPCGRWMVLLTEGTPRPGVPVTYPAAFRCYLCGAAAAAPDQPAAMTDGAKRWERVNGEPVPD